MFSIKKIISKLKNGTKQGNTPDRMSRVLLAAQRKAADCLNRKAARWSARRLKVILILFCLLIGSICLFIAGKAILSANGPPGFFKVQRLLMPSPLLIPGSKKHQKPDSTTK